MKIAFQGVHGAYSELASRALFGPRCQTLPYDTFEGVFGAVDGKKADRGVIPIENSLAGSIHQNYDLLVQRGLHIVGETYLRVEHALLAHSSARFGDIRRVRSHPQALAQCSDFFARHPHVQSVVYFDTAGAARSVAQEIPDGVAAIASEYAGKLYGLRVLRRNLQNRAVNYTRFLAIARSPVPSKGRKSSKTSITFIPNRNESGALHRLLGVFAERGIDLTKVESRPDPAKPFDYRFYLDLAAGAGDAPVREALKLLRGSVKDLRVLGSYPRAVLPVRKGK